MLAVHDVNVTLSEYVMTSGTEGSKVASEVILSRPDRPASARPPRRSDPQRTPRHYGSQQGLTTPQRAPQRVGGAPLIHAWHTDCGRAFRTPRAVPIPVGGWF